MIGGSGDDGQRSSLSGRRLVVESELNASSDVGSDVTESCEDTSKQRITDGRSGADGQLLVAPRQ